MDIIKFYLEGKSVKNISKIFQISCAEVYTKLETENYYTRGKNIKDAIKLKKSLDLYIGDEKMSLKDVSKITDIDPEVLSKYLRRKGINPRLRQNKPKINQHVFDCIDSEEKAYWLGFIFADGYIQSFPTNNVGMKYIFSFCLSYQDYGHLEKFNDFINYGVNKIYVDYLTVNGIKKPRCKWSVGNKHLWNTLNNLGCTPRKTLTLKFPNIPDNLVRHFIRGYFDGDGTLGCYSPRQQPSCSLVGTLDFVENINRALNVSGSIYKHKKHRDVTKTLSFCSQRAMDFLSFLYLDFTIYLDRKYNKFLEMTKIWDTQLQKRNLIK